MYARVQYPLQEEEPLSEATYTLEQQIKVVEREIAVRKRVYPRLVANARMKPERAAFEMGVMKAVLATLERQSVS